MCGAIPGFEFFAEHTGIQTYSSLPGFCHLDESHLKLLEALKKTDKSVVDFNSKFPSWLADRRNVIKAINELADNIEWHHRNISAVQIPTSLFGIAGAVMTITGLALIPVTFGASLGLTIAGAAVGVSAGVTGVTTSVTDLGIAISRSKKAKSIVEEHKASTEEMVKIANAVLDNSLEVCQLATPKSLSVLKETFIRNGGQFAHNAILSMKTGAIVGLSLIKTIPKAARSLTHLRKGFGVAATAGTSTFRTFEMAATDSASGAVRVVATTTGKALTICGFVFSAIGIAVDVVSIAVASYDLAKGSKTSVSKQLRNVASQLEKEVSIMEELKSKLDACSE